MLEFSAPLDFFEADLDEVVDYDVKSSFLLDSLQRLNVSERKSDIMKLWKASGFLDFFG